MKILSLIICGFTWASLSEARAPLRQDILIPSKKFVVALKEASGGKTLKGFSCKDPSAPTVSCLAIAENWETPDTKSPSFSKEFYLGSESNAVEMFASLNLPTQTTDIPDTKETVFLKFLDVMDPYMGEIGLICAVILSNEGEINQALCTLFSETPLQAN